MPAYSVSQSNITGNTSNDILTLISAANRRVKILEVIVAGQGTASAAGEIRLQRSTGGTTGGGAVTPEKGIDADIPAASTTVNTTWAAQPTLSGTPYKRLPANANGGVFRWVAIPNKEELEFRNGDQVSIRPSIGTGPFMVDVTFWED
jgi:hypothetical protein